MTDAHITNAGRVEMERAIRAAIAEGRLIVCGECGFMMGPHELNGDEHREYHENWKRGHSND